MASGWPGKGHGTLLKKSLSEWSVVQNRSQTPTNQGQNTTKAGFYAPQQGSENGMKEFFNTLTPSRHFGEEAGYAPNGLLVTAK
jgi:hypothetical protein